MKDLKPLIQRNETNGLSKAEQVRDQIYTVFFDVAAKQQVDVLILKSPPYTAPPWVRIECWVRHSSDPALTLRSEAVFTVRPREFYRFPIEIDMVISNDKRSRTWRCITSFKSSDAEEVLQNLLYQKRSRSFGLDRCRVWPFQFWLPKNKPARLGFDTMQAATQVLFVVGFMTLGVYGIGVLFMAGGGIMAYYNSKRRRHILSAGKPSQEPRRLIRLDSWQALVKDLGSEREIIKKDIQAELTYVAEENCTIADERIWYWGVDGKEEREQLVVCFRRSIAFIHIYPYGQDLFVGWDAHVNCGTWVEQVAGGGFDKNVQEFCVVHTIAAGWHVPNEYDITDTNCLLERVHAAVTKVVKIKLAELNIDQEIDFTILREQRQNVVGRPAPDGKAVTGSAQGVMSKFRRVG